MISEIIMDRLGWTDIWYAHPGPYARRIFSTFGPLPKRWHVGVWTGPDRDLICVRHCEDLASARASKSPGARTILGAVVAALVVRYRTSS